MKWQLLLVGLLLMGCVASVGAVRENFQSWGSNTPLATWYGGGGYGVSIISPTMGIADSTIGDVSYVIYPSGYSSYIGSGIINWYVMPNTASYFTYAAFDTFASASGSSGGTDAGVSFTIYDANKNSMGSFGTNNLKTSSRYELNIIGGDPWIFRDGVHIGNISCSGPNSPHCSINPSYVAFGSSQGYTIWGATESMYTDNYIVGEADPHVVGALPSNWTIQRDLINPSATGVFAWNNASQTWVAQNSQYFYIDADTSSQQSATTEYFDIMYQGAIVNTTIIHDQTSPRNQIQYNVSEFLNTAYFSSVLPDGQYYAQFRGYPDSRSYFWVTSSGASVSWDKTTYPQSSTATLTYAVSNSYWQPSTYTYSLVVVNTAGTTLQTYSLNSQTGTESLQLNPTTYPAGAYYAEVIATDNSGNKNIMNYAAAQVTSYSYISGYVMNAETGAVLSGATVNTTQGAVTESQTSSASGYTMNTGWLTGGLLSVTTNLTGYTTDVRSFSPMAAGNIPLNITLLSTTPSHTGVSIGGIVRDNQYGNPVTSATVNVYNTSTSESYNNVTNIAGYYLVNNLVGNRLYNVSSTKSGYSNSTIAQVVAVGV